MARGRSDLDNNILSVLGETVVTGTPNRNMPVIEPEEVVVPPEGIGPLLYGRSPTPIKSGLEALRERFLGGLRNMSGLVASKASTRNEILDIAEEVLANSKDMNEATFMFFPYLRELAPGATYQNARSYLDSIQRPSGIKSLEE
tara:strand:+ start:718 stop:1149 length:432 start_codon:yes stop_codon:yes gene_type:complete